MTTTSHSKPVRDLIVESARQKIGEREQPPGSNRGPFVDEVNRSAGAPLGSPWCASFQHWLGRQHGLKLPNAWSPSWFPKTNIIDEKNARAGDYYGIYSAKLGRVIHIGIAQRLTDSHVLGIEGNTNAAGSAEGDSVMLKRRLRSSLVWSRHLP